MALSRRNHRRVHGIVGEAGSSLVEALVAASVVLTVAAGVAQLLIWSRRAVWGAGTETAAVSLAVEKLEQLRALEWRVDAAGIRHSDRTTNLSAAAPAANGTGLQRSPPGALARNTPGFMDFVAADGGWRGSGPGTPAGAAYVRRWSITPLEIDPDDTLILTVAVTPLADVEARASGSGGGHGARVQTIATRTAR